MTESMFHYVIENFVVKRQKGVAAMQITHC